MWYCSYMNQNTKKCHFNVPGTELKDNSMYIASTANYANL
jgi:hypothetical protein